MITTGANNIIKVDPPTLEAKKLWAMAIELADAFGSNEPWVLVGGLMVQLHSFEYGGGRARPTTDIDVLGDSRLRPMTERISEVLIERGGEMAQPSVSDGDLGYQFVVGGETVEVLGCDGLKGGPKTIGKYTTIQVPGGTQALQRSEIVRVSLDGGDPTEIRRPSLLGAILIKARIVAKKRDKFASDRQDLIRLLSFVENPREMAKTDGLTKKEKKWLGDIEGLLNFADPALPMLFPGGEVARAEPAYRLLIAKGSLR